VTHRFSRAGAPFPLTAHSAVPHASRPALRRAVVSSAAPAIANGVAVKSEAPEAEKPAAAAAGAPWLGRLFMCARASGSLCGRLLYAQCLTEQSHTLG